MFCVDRSGAAVFGTSCVLWSLSLDGVAVLGGPQPDAARALAQDRDGFLPSWLARAWGDVLFERLADLVLVSRPARRGSTDLVPVGLYRRGTAVQAAWSRTGEHLGVYDTAVAPVLLHLAQVLTVAGGLVVTSLRPPAPGTPVSDVAARAVRRRSGLLAPR